jgi:NitT/TauT family transport system substrate-binding protein
MERKQMQHAQRRPPHLLAALLAVVVILAACGAPAAQPASPAATAAPEQPAATTAPADAGAAPAAVTLRTGYIPVVIFAPLFVGIERGYFAEEGITIELTPIQSGNEAVVQLAAGNFDVSLGGANAGLYNAAARGVEFTIVAPLHSERPPVVTPLIISAKRAGEITSIEQLRGKKVAVNAVGAGTEYWLAQALAKGGLTMNDIELVGMPFPNIPAALENGALDAAVVTEPIVTINTDNGLVSVLADDFIDGFTATYVYMGDALLTGQPEVARGFMKAYLRATRDLQGEYMSDEVATIIEKYSTVPADVLKRIAAPQYNPNGTVPVENLEALQVYFKERGLLEYDELLDVKTIVNTELAAEVAAELDAGK